MMLLLAFFVPLATFAQQSLPYNYGFEVQSTDALLADGWSLQECNSSTCSAGSNAVHGGSRGFQFFYGSNPVYNQYLISPELTVPTGGARITFWYKNFTVSYNATFKVGYSSTDTNLDNFTWSFETTTATNQWQQSVPYECPAGTKYVAICCLTNYYFFVDDFSVTLPSPQAVNPDYTYGFETSTTEIVDGWTTLNRHQYTYNATGSAPHSGSRGLEFYGNTVAATATQYLISPELQDGGNGLAFQFWYKCYNSTSHTFRVGYSATPNIADFVWGSSNSVNNGDWALLDLQICERTNTNNMPIKYVAVECTSSASYLFIDDFTISLIPECDMPETLEASDITTDGAVLTWTGGSGTYNVEYKKASDTEWISHATNINGYTTTLSELEPGIAYQARVQSVCKGGELLSGWKSVDFITDCEAVTLPYTYGFEDSESSKWNCWEKGTGITIATGSAIHEGGKGLQFYNANGSTFVSPELEGTENGAAFYFYYGVYSSAQTFQVGYCVNGNWTWTDDIEASNITNSNSQDYAGWVQYVNEQLPENTTQVAIKCTSSYYFFVDDIEITGAPSCEAPTNLTVSDITATTAFISWSGGSGTYCIDYREVSGSWNEAPLVPNHPGGSYTIQGLTPNTTYQARVQSICGEYESAWSNVVEFTTTCGAYEIPYEYGFEDANDYICWTPVGASTTYRTTSSSAHSGSYVFQFYNNANDEYPEQYLYIPELAGNGEEQIVLSFWYRNWASYYNSTLQVGHKANETDAFAWEDVDIEGNAWTEYFSILPANTKYVALMCHVYNPGTGEEPTPGSSWFLLDDFSFTYLPKSFVTAGAWGNANNWSPAGVPTETENVLVLAAATIEAGTVATANTITIKNDGSITIKDGGQLIHNTNGLTATVEKDINAWIIESNSGENKADGWYFIANPLTTTIAPANAGLLNDEDKYDLYRFVAGEGEDYLEWINYRNSAFDLIAGYSYLYANEEDITLNFTGTVYPSFNKTYSVNFTAYNQSSTAAFNGWRLVGNLFVCDGYVQLMKNGEPVNADFYVMNEAGDDLVISESSVALAPCQGAFIYAEEAYDAENNPVKITYTTVAPEPNPEGKLCINLSENQAILDKARINFGVSGQLPKMSLRQNSSKVYIPQGNRDFAVVHSNGQGEMPVNFKAEHNGTFTLNFDSENVEFNSLYLIDNMTGANVDLMANPSYTFEATTTDYASRFRLVFNTNNVEESNANFAYYNGSEWVVNASANATLQVVDMMGRVVRTSEAARHIATEGLTQGLYVIRLIEGDNMKTQKIVVR